MESTDLSKVWEFGNVRQEQNPTSSSYTQLPTLESPTFLEIKVAPREQLPIKFSERLDPFNIQTVEESFLKTHGSVNNLFENFIGLESKIVRRVGTSTFENNTAIANPEVPAIPASASSMYVTRERLAMGRILNQTKHSILIPQQTPPEEVLQRIEQALAVHLGNDFIRESVYSHYGS